MVRIEKSIDVYSPLRSVYRQWTRFEEFPDFMAGMIDVEQLDDTHVRCYAEVGGEEQELEAEIVDHVPNEYIAWRSNLAGYPAAGVVQFESLGPDVTRVQLVVAYEPASEEPGEEAQALDTCVQDTIEGFKMLIEADNA